MNESSTPEGTPGGVPAVQRTSTTPTPPPAPSAPAAERGAATPATSSAEHASPVGTPRVANPTAAPNGGDDGARSAPEGGNGGGGGARSASEGGNGASSGGESGRPATEDVGGGEPGTGASRNRRRRGGRGRGRPAGAPRSPDGTETSDGTVDGTVDVAGDGASGRRAEGGARGVRAGIGGDDRNPEELPKPEREGRASAEDAEVGLVRRPEVGDTKPRIGDTRPAPASTGTGSGSSAEGGDGTGPAKKRRRRGGRGRSGNKSGGEQGGGTPRNDGQGGGQRGGRQSAKGRQPVGVRSGVARPVTALTGGDAVDLDDEVIEGRRGRNRKGRPVGRYLMAVHVQPDATQIAVLEGRALIEHYVARPSDDISQIHGNIYLGRVQNVLPGMEAAFIDIGTPKNAVLYRGDLHFDAEDIEERDNARIEQLLRPKQTILCQVTKNPIMHKGARLTQEVSLPGRFVVLVPNSRTLGISKRLPDSERKRLRGILDKCRPEGHGVIVRTAAEGITGPEIERDLQRLVDQWTKIDALARKVSAPALLYREPDMALRVIREEFSRDYRKIIIDDQAIFEDVRDYVGSVSPALTERVEHYDAATEPLPIFEKHHIIEQLHRALDRKVWLPSGGSLIIEHTEALTVIDVNTGKNVGTSNLEDTVFSNNLEAAEEIARQLRLRDVGGIIVIDFIDMEIKANRAKVIKVFRDALARDKTRTQVFDISELGLVQMTRKRIGEGLLESFTSRCEVCEGRGVVFDRGLLE